MEGTNPSDKKKRSDDKKVTQNEIAINTANSSQGTEAQSDHHKVEKPVAPVEPSAQAVEKEKSPDMVHSTTTADERTITETASPEPNRTAVKTVEEPVKRSAAFSLIEMLTHPNEHLRIEAIESLLKIGDKSLSYAFASAMKDESFRVRLGALRGLYKFGGDSATEYLITALEDKHQDVRRRAIIYLGWMRKHEVLPFLTAALADHSSRVRKVAAYALGDVKDVSAVPYLMKALQDTDPEVIKGALAALKRITGKSFSDEQQSPQKDQQEIIRKWNEWWKKQEK